MAVRRARRAQHRHLLRHALRQRLSPARWHGSGARCRPAPGGGGADPAPADRARRDPHGGRRCDRRRRSHPGRSHRGGEPGRRRDHRGTDRHRVDGAGARADQTLGPAGGAAAHLDGLAARRGRRAAGPGRPGGRGPARRVDLRKPRRVRVPVADRHGHGVLGVVLGPAAAARGKGLAAGAAVTGRGHGPGLGGARPTPDAHAGGGHGARLRRRGLGAAVSEGPRCAPHAGESRFGRPGAWPDRRRRWS